MALLLRNPVVLFAVFAAAFGTISVFTFAKPEYRRAAESEMIDFSKRDYYSPVVVRRAFGAQGLPLRHGTSDHGAHWLSNRPPPFPAASLQVMIVPHASRGSWGPKLARYDERFGNVLVTYDGPSDEIVRRIDAAVEQIRDY